ncbi:TetR/AcrR family transcriptional regulator [Rathayibacter tritici]|uniref:TetR family transcriptional regulator n=1 Tax=Rathayibacter tritici TaxID=33888 RepID=A0A160KV20_9MICO|nr:TetR/AcrR family transcriptional regulator [Rathayibacter tritici]AND17527.1 TetR family transcriptional regulator [Rathayibacter tritici]PPF29888.1 TetR/AcrR family transcriptional regulator [Rathayibacter tritici]PPF65296.1 TetR/AcrR family transcriptional regulator [Rathayibacter tritici]PPG06052.1 TetR/AcrR family transcriptional regulator [Rathayibacter tritici]PPI19899.1 TetR/AcrR family transcriptional regulator [Rathayibacter tritici]
MSPTLDERPPREAILAAADRLYYERGIQSVGMDELRTAAEVSLKRLYSVFPSKESVIVAVLHGRHEQWTLGVSARVAAASGPRGKLLAIYDFLFDWFSEDSFRGCGFINAFGELGSSNPAVAEMAREHKESFQRFLASLAEDAGGGSELAAQLAILAEGAQTTAAIAGTPEAALHARRAAEILIDAETRTA